MNRRTALMNMLVGSAALTAASPIAAAAVPAIAESDAELFQLEEQIFEAQEAATARDEDIRRLGYIWGAEAQRLYDEVYVYGTSKLTHDERWNFVKAMPETIEHDRLIRIQDQHYGKMNDLIYKMWAIPARTPEGRRSKLFVLLNCILSSDWREHDEDADWHIEMARKMMIEFVGGEPAKELRDQFA